MPRHRRSAPVVKYHVSGQARIYLDGAYRYLGPYGSAEAQVKLDSILAEYHANGRRLPCDRIRLADEVVTVSDVAAAYRREIETRPKPLGRYRHLTKLIEDEYGDRPAADFGPRALRDIRELLIATGISRQTINEQVRRIAMMFEHAVSLELIELEVYQRLLTLKPLRTNQTTAPETKRRTPPKIEHIRAALEFMSPPARAAIIVQAMTGMRSDEVLTMTPGDIDRSGDEWLYRVREHKTQHFGVERTVPIVGLAKEAILEFVEREASEFLFSAKEGRDWFLAQRRASRKTPVSYGNRPGTNRRKHPKRAPGKRYTPKSLCQQVESACKKAGVPRWTPGQLRHLTATEVADAIGLEHSQALLSHTTSTMTRRYVHSKKREEQKAIEAARAVRFKI